MVELIKQNETFTFDKGEYTYVINANYKNEEVWNVRRREKGTIDIPPRNQIYSVEDTWKSLINNNDFKHFSSREEVEEFLQSQP
jgi:hypothetical protein